MSFFLWIIIRSIKPEIITKNGLQIAWILFQSTTLSLVSKAFIKSVNQFSAINIHTQNQQFQIHHICLYVIYSKNG